MNDTITTPETPSLTTARSQPQTLAKSTAAVSEPTVIEPQPDSIRDLPASLVNANEQQALSQYPHPHPEPDSHPHPEPVEIWGAVNQLESAHNALAKAFMELQAKLARHFPALF